MREDENEYSIIMLKPFQFREQMKEMLLVELKCEGLTIETSKKYNLKENEIRKCFYHVNEEYIEYLMCDYVEFILVRGKQTHEKTYQIKKRIRKAFGVANVMCNGIHTTDPGNEYHLLLKNFFRECKQSHYSNLVDSNLCYGIYYHGITDFCRLLNSNEHNIRYGILNLSTFLEDDMDEILKNISRESNHFSVGIYVYSFYCGRNVRLVLNMEKISMIPHVLKYSNQILTLQEIWKIINTFQLEAYLEYIDVSEEEIKEYYDCVFSHYKEDITTLLGKMPLFRIIAEICRYGIKGIYCFKPCFQLVETELYMDLCRVNCLKELGGSSGLCKLGEFSV